MNHLPLVIDPNDGRPAYRKIADGIKELIVRGEMTEGMAPPSVGQIA
jgi:DNA-binding transcriptional regulator YhcF (GntR family)